MPTNFTSEPFIVCSVGFQDWKVHVPSSVVTAANEFMDGVTFLPFSLSFSSPGNSFVTSSGRVLLESSGTNSYVTLYLFVKVFVKLYPSSLLVEL